LPKPFGESGRPFSTAQDPDVSHIRTKQNFKNRQVVFGRMTKEQGETELVESVLVSNFSGKADKNLAGSRKPLLICEPRSRIDHVTSKSRLARKRRYRHRHLTSAKDEEIRIMANHFDEDLHLCSLSFARRPKAPVQSHGAREALRQ